MVTATASAAIGRYVPEERIDAEASQFVTAARSAIDSFIVMERGEVVMKGSGEELAGDDVRKRIAI